MVRHAFRLASSFDRRSGEDRFICRVQSRWVQQRNTIALTCWNSTKLVERENVLGVLCALVSNSERSNPLSIIKCVKWRNPFRYNWFGKQQRTKNKPALLSYIIHHVSYPNVFIVHKSQFSRIEKKKSLRFYDQPAKFKRWMKSFMPPKILTKLCMCIQWNKHLNKICIEV